MPRYNERNNLSIGQNVAIFPFVSYLLMHLFYVPLHSNKRFSILRDEEPFPMCFTDFLILPAAAATAHERLSERYRATTDRYAGETKQNAEVTAKKQAACKPTLLGSRGHQACCAAPLVKSSLR